MKIAVTGATGFVGSRLCERLLEQGHTLVVLSRNPDAARLRFPQADCRAWDPASGAQPDLSGCEAVVNLAGAPIADERWTEARQQLIRDSRIRGTEALVAAAAAQAERPRVLINASAIGFYGTSETATFTEASPAGTDFLAQVCRDWEAAALAAESQGVRTVVLRLGIVLGNGGAIAKMLLPFRTFAGGPLGSGRQWFSWAQREDVVGLILWALERQECRGIYNATAPNPVRMAELCQVLGKVLSRPSWLPVPDFALQALLGDAAQVVLEGQRVLPERAQAEGFSFRYPDLEAALRQFLP